MGIILAANSEVEVKTHTNGLLGRLWDHFEEGWSSWERIPFSADVESGWQVAVLPGHHSEGVWFGTVVYDMGGYLVARGEQRP